MSELNPCPFCGGKGILRKLELQFAADFLPECQNARCGVCLEAYPTEAKAITAWNTRTPDPRVIKLLADIGKARVDMAALIPRPDDPNPEDWPCENPADRSCLQEVYVRLTDALSAFNGDGK